MLNKNFAVAIRAARAGVELSQDDLAKLSGTSRPTINRIETEGSSKLNTLDAITQALKELGVTIEFSEDKVTVTFLTTM